MSKIDHPDHYNHAGSQYEVINIIENWELGFCLGNTLKYILRAGRKENELEDLEKALWYLRRDAKNRNSTFRTPDISESDVINAYKLHNSHLAKVIKTLHHPCKDEAIDALKKHILSVKFRNKRTVAFDLDDTLAHSKQVLKQDMAKKLLELASTGRQIVIISGASYKQMQKQVIPILEGVYLNQLHDVVGRIHLMPTSGATHFVLTGVEEDTGQYRDPPRASVTGDYSFSFTKVHDIKISKEEIERIKDNIVQSGILALSPEKTYGNVVEDRKSQVTISFLGQKAPLNEKRQFDPDRSIRKTVVRILQSKLPEYDIALGGSTSVDIVMKGVNKGDSLKRMGPPEELIFFGDALHPGGNDYTVKQAGFDVIEVNSPHDTYAKITDLLK